MTLTVPTAGTTAGRTADVRIARVDIGAPIAALGEAIQQRGLALQKDQNKINLRRAQLDMTRELGEARLELEQSSDPDAIDTGWQQRVAEIRARHLGPDENGKPRWDDETQAELDLNLTELSDRHALALGGRAIELRQSAGEASWIEARADIVTRAGSADPDTVGAYLELADAQIADRLQRGTITPAQAAKERLDFRQEVASARADTLLESSPDAFLKATDPEGGTGEFNDIGPQGLAARRIEAQRALDRKAALAAKDAEVAKKEREQAIGKRLDEMTRMMSKGFTVADEAYMNNPEVQAHSMYPVAKAAQSLRDENPAIRTMTVAELDQQIAKEMARPIAHEFQTKRVEVLKSWRNEAATRADTDAVGLAQDAGRAVPQLPDFDPAAADSFAAGLSSRLAFDETERGRGATRTQAIFSAAERERLKPILAPDADPAAKLALAQSMLAASGGRIDRIASAAGADPVFTRAARMLHQTRNTGLAEEILRGQQKAATGTVNLPTEKRMVTAFDEITGGIFDANPKQKAEVLAAARALYADAAAGVNPDGKDSMVPFMDDEDAQMLFETSVQRVLGAAPDANGVLTVGGVQEINGARVSLPPGIRADDVEETFDNLSRHLAGNVRNEWMGAQNWGFPKDGSEPDRMRAFKAASLDGSAPNLGKSPEDRWPSLTLHHVDESGVYELRYMHLGRIYTVPKAGDPAGTAYRFRLSDLMREAQR